MTSLHIIEKEINKFLSSNTPEVIVIRGAWGVGKTYIWNECLKAAKSKNQITLDKYAYVSLFGIDSLDTLKLELLRNTISHKTYLNKFMRWWTNQWKRIKSFFFNIGKNSGLPYKVDTIINMFLSSSPTTNTIICIDDFERATLNALEVLGLISDLKEQKQCKVVLIMNEDNLSENTKANYDIHREKIIDKEFVFNPIPQECAKIIFSDNQYCNILIDRCSTLGIRNIRILKKINQLTDDIMPFLENCEEKTKYNVLSSLALLTFSFYVKDDNIPNFEFIQNIADQFVNATVYEFNQIFEANFTNIEENKSSIVDTLKEKEKKALWEQFLYDYGYAATDHLDLEIANFVKRGYIDNDLQIVKSIKHYNDIITQETLNNSYDKAWEIFRSSFDDNTTELINKMYDAVQICISHITPYNLDASIKLLRELKADDKADELIGLVVESKKEDLDYFNIDSYELRELISDQKMIAEFTKVYSAKEIKKTPIDIINNTVPNELTNKDIEILASYRPDDYYNIFKLKTISLRRIALYANHNNCLQASKKGKLIADNLRTALNKIASENHLNKLRVGTLLN